MLTPRGAPKAASPEARPGAVADMELRPMAPEARASEAPAVPHEATPGGIPPADHLDASAMPHADPCAERLGRFCMDFEALRKRKEAFVRDDRPCRPLKRRKYFAMDE